MIGVTRRKYINRTRNKTGTTNVRVLQKRGRNNVLEKSFDGSRDESDIERPVEIEQITFSHGAKVMGGCVDVVSYDITTLYFETSDEDDLRPTGVFKGRQIRLSADFVRVVGYKVGIADKL